MYMLCTHMACQDGVMTCDVASTLIRHCLIFINCFGIILHVPPGTPNMYIIAVIILVTIRRNVRVMRRL